MYAKLFDLLKRRIRFDKHKFRRAGKIQSAPKRLKSALVLHPLEINGQYKLKKCLK